MNLFNLSDKDIATLRQDTPAWKACPHWSFMRPFRWKDEWHILFVCDTPEPDDPDWLGEFPRTTTCFVYAPNALATYHKILAIDLPIIAVLSIKTGVTTHIGSLLPNNYLPNPFYLDRTEFDTNRDEILVAANKWADSVEEKE